MIEVEDETFDYKLFDYHLPKSNAAFLKRVTCIVPLRIIEFPSVRIVNFVQL